jgi:hypothetical protein
MWGCGYGVSSEGDNDKAGKESDAKERENGMGICHLCDWAQFK